MLVEPLLLAHHALTHDLCVWIGGFSSIASIDGLDIAEISPPAQGVMASKSFQQPLMCSLLLMLVGNALSLWRLAKREHDLQDWPGLPTYIRHLRDVGHVLDFMATCAEQLLVNGGKPPHSAPAAPPSRPQDTFDTLRAQLQAIKSHRRRRDWFRSEKGVEYRVFSSASCKHMMVKAPSSGWCYYCSRNEPVEPIAPASGETPRPRKMRRTGSRTSYQCSQCNVRLCMARGQGSPSCFAAFHRADAVL